MIPPPNVTGTLHMGHAFQDTIMDTLIRYHRMHGDNTLWQAGTDHAGIATQMVVERQLERARQVASRSRPRNISRSESGNGRRNPATPSPARCAAWAPRSTGRASASPWTRACRTRSREVFVRLYEEGLIYRGKRLVNWDPVLHTAVSDLEVLSEEEAGSLWHIRYPARGQQGLIWWSRPRARKPCSAIPRSRSIPRMSATRHLIGKQVELPLTGRQIPIIADDYVDPEFGTGCVKITPAHDFNDYEVGKRHNLPLINIFTIDARIELPGSNIPGPRPLRGAQAGRRRSRSRRACSKKSNRTS